MSFQQFYVYIADINLLAVNFDKVTVSSNTLGNTETKTQLNHVKSLKPLDIQR